MNRWYAFKTFTYVFDPVHQMSHRDFLRAGEPHSVIQSYITNWIQIKVSSDICVEEIF